MIPRLHAAAQSVSRPACRQITTQVSVPTTLNQLRTYGRSRPRVGPNQHKEPSSIAITPHDSTKPSVSLTIPKTHPKTHGIPVAILHLRSPQPVLLSLFIHFALHTAYAMGIPCSRAAALPTQRSLYTVMRSPFIYKGAQENFEKVVHKRAIKVWDADPEVVGKWLKYLELNEMAGVGMRVVRWERAEVGFGANLLEEVQTSNRERRAQVATRPRDPRSMAEQVQDLANQIIAAELEASAAMTIPEMPEPPVGKEARKSSKVKERSEEDSGNVQAALEIDPAPQTHDSSTVLGPEHIVAASGVEFISPLQVTPSLSESLDETPLHGRSNETIMFDDVPIAPTANTPPPISSLHDKAPTMNESATKGASSSSSPSIVAASLAEAVSPADALSIPDSTIRASPEIIGETPLQGRTESIAFDNIPVQPSTTSPSRSAGKDHIPTEEKNFSVTVDSGVGVSKSLKGKVDVDKKE